MKLTPPMFARIARGSAGMRRKVLRQFGLAIIFVLSLAVVAPAALANCVLPKNYSPRSIPLNMGTVTVNPEVQVGGIIKSAQFPVPLVNPQTDQYGAYSTFTTCNGGGNVYYALQNPLATSYDRVYATSVPGVGLRLTLFSPKGPLGSTTTNFPGQQYVPSYFSGVGFYGSDYFQVDLVKTAESTGNGPLAPGTYATISGDDGLSAVTLSINANSVTIASSSCAVDAGSLTIPVEFGSVSLKSFAGPGSAVTGRNFAIQLNCPGGQGAAKNIYVALDGVEDPAAVGKGALQITQGTGSASGVAIQLLDSHGVPISFRQPALIGSTKELKPSVQYTARYFQTGPQVMPGVANGTATFSVSYK